MDKGRIWCRSTACRDDRSRVRLLSQCSSVLRSRIARLPFTSKRLETCSRWVFFFHGRRAAELHTLARAYALQQHDSRYNGWDLNLRDSAHFERGLFGTVGEQLPVLLGASLLLMLLVCINVASLLGQHGARRRREVAIRTALGATPGKIVALVLAETGFTGISRRACGVGRTGSC